MVRGEAVVSMLRGTALAVLLAVAGCAAPDLAVCSPAERAQGCSIRTELYFGLSLPDGTFLSDAEWQGFLADTVTPLFPDGFTVLAGDGQWRDPASGKIGREPSRVLVIIHDKSDDDERIAALIGAYKKSFLQQSVLRVDMKATARF
jgi:hypothetical protein